MDNHDMTIKSYLGELYRLSGGDTEFQVSMYDVGAAIGLDKAQAGSLAEELMVQGQAELRTLAGGISITPDGLAILGFSAAPAPQSSDNSLNLSKGPVASESDRETIQSVLEKIKPEISGQQLDYAVLEEIVMDLKTIEVQMLSPNPKIAILKPILHSLQDTLETGKVENAVTMLKGLTC